jgi:hypothetical protein
LWIGPAGTRLSVIVVERDVAEASFPIPAPSEVADRLNLFEVADQDFHRVRPVEREGMEVFCHLFPYSWAAGRQNGVAAQFDLRADVFPEAA